MIYEQDGELMIEKAFWALFLCFFVVAAYQLSASDLGCNVQLQSKIVVAGVIVRSPSCPECVEFFSRVAFGKSKEEAEKNLELKTGEAVLYFEADYSEKKGYYTILSAWAYTSPQKRTYIIELGVGNDYDSALKEAQALLNDKYIELLRLACGNRFFRSSDIWYDIPYFYLKKPTMFSMNDQ